MNESSPDLRELQARALSMTQQGRHDEALRAWRELIAAAPQHVQARVSLAQLEFARGAYEPARAAFEAVCRMVPGDVEAWIHLAMCAERQRDDAGQRAALHRALSIDPYHVLALLMRGRLRERAGNPQAAAHDYGAAAAVAPDADRVDPTLRPLLRHAQQFRAQHQARLGRFLEQRLESTRQGATAESRERFDLAVDIMLGRKRRFDSQPMLFYVPGLPPVEFFDRRHFPWLDEVEAATDDVRAELLTVLAQDSGFEPYIQYGADMPVAQWAELNHNPAWSAFHLVRSGVRVEANSQRCPRTMQMWSRVPSPKQAGRTPVALFSLLRPHTRIPPHVGASNARLLVHLPLVVPPGCWFRVGNTTREWQPGRAWVFDDTIEHEAANNSDELRAIMIFDTWHPALAEDERAMLSELSEALVAFGGGDASGYES